MDKKMTLSVNDIQNIGKQSIGKKISEIIGESFVDKLGHKGQIGHILEEKLFGQKPHNDSEPDFKEAGVELKVTPIKKLNNGTFSAKERLVLNLINYETENLNNFEESSFWKKNRQLYILFYEYIQDLPKSEYRIYSDLLHTFSKQDLTQVKKDWETIVAKIKDGKAHEISESDTMYLAACTKGANGNEFRNQPFSNIEAKPRAYSLKQSYITTQIRKLKDKSIYKLIDDDKLDLISYLDKKLSQYKGRNLKELKSLFRISSTSKNVNELLVSAMLGLKGKKISKSEEFIKANIKFKTIRMESDLSLRESMSFSNFKFDEINKESWDDSALRDFYLTTKFAFCLFIGGKENPVFKGVKFWNLDEQTLDNELKPVWEKTVLTIKLGNVYKSKFTNESNFPKASESNFAHVRPKGRDSKDTYPLPVKDKLTSKNYYTKQCFWLNASYIKLVILNLFNLH
jgi:DNA mismatch repair protein MutH